MGRWSGMQKFINKLQNYSVSDLQADCKAAGVHLNTTKDIPKGLQPTISEDFTGTIDGVYYINGCSQSFSKDDHDSILIHGKPGQVHTVSEDGEPWGW